VSINPQKRFDQGHKKNFDSFVGKAIKKYSDEIELVILHGNISEEKALQLEKKYRPKECIGWNIAPGGGKPPVCKKGVVKKETTKKKLSQTWKKKYSKGESHLAKWNGSQEQKDYLKKIYKDRKITWGENISKAKKVNPFPSGNPMENKVSRKKVSNSKKGLKALYKNGSRKMALPLSEKWNVLISEGWIPKDGA